MQIRHMLMFTFWMWSQVSGAPGLITQTSKLQVWTDSDPTEQPKKGSAEGRSYERKKEESVLWEMEDHTYNLPQEKVKEPEILIIKEA